MKEDVNTLSFSFVLDLYRIKERAIKRKDQPAIDSLQKTYPSLFSDEFEEFIQNLKLSISYIDQKHGTNFQKMIDADEQKIDNSLH